jgi:glycosyl transferase family 25
MDRVKLLVINRDRDTERLDSTRRELERFGLAFERIAAFEAAAVTEATIADLVKPRLHSLVAKHPDYVRDGDRGVMVFMPEHHRYLVAAEIACYLSHRRAIEALMVSDADAGIVFEDDVALADDFPDVLAAAVTLGPRAHIVKLEGLYAAHRVHLRVASVGAREIALMLKPTTGAAAYLVTREAAKRLHRRMLPIREPYDAFLRQYWWHGLDVLEAVPFPVRQLPFPTTIPQRREQALVPDLPASKVAALAAATPLLKFARLMRRGAALARRAHRLPRLRFRLRGAASKPQSG